MNLKRIRRGRRIPLFIGCFYAGLAAGWWSRGHIDGRLSAATTSLVEAPAVTPTPPQSSEVPRSIDDAPAESDSIRALRARRLLLPVGGADVAGMKGQFGDRRDHGARGHEAVDLLAPRGTAVRAVEDGTIAKLFTSKAGGLTIYLFDPSRRFCYYYAHLDRYAPGLRDGQRVSRGDFIATVGTTGNAPPNTPHLHFAVFELTEAKRWWEGRPLDPYEIFRP